MKILVVDDSKTIHTFIEDCLKEENHFLVHVYNGKEAISELARQTDFDLILMDWEMPELTGPDTVREIKKMDDDTPIVMVTTKGKSTDISSMIDAGVVEYITKPFTKDILIEKIAYVVDGVE